MGIVVVLLFVIVIFGIVAGMQSYATAQQAQAQIETAKVAQINATGNLITILTLALMIVVAVAIAAAIVFWILRRAAQRSTATGTGNVDRAMTAPRAQPQISIDDLLKLKMIQMLSQMDQRQDPRPTTLSLPAPGQEQQADDDLFQWLR